MTPLVIGIWIVIALFTALAWVFIYIKEEDAIIATMYIFLAWIIILVLGGITLLVAMFLADLVTWGGGL